MKAIELIREQIPVAENALYRILIWQVPQPVTGSAHDYKYSLAYIVDNVCVLRYDNEAGKGDHRHWGDKETPYRFTHINQLIRDFRSDIQRWNDENHNS
jgi:hypothetical protein